MASLPPAPPPPPVDERRTRRRALWFGIFIGLIVLIVGSIGISIEDGLKQLGSGSMSSAAISETALSGSGPNKIAIIPIHGEVVTEDSSDPSVVSAQTIKAMVQQAKDDPHVQAVILDVDSPGGSVVAAGEMYDALKSLHKPIVALYSGDLAASGGLYVSMAANKIVSYPETLTGSIGVIAEFVDISQLMQKYGITVNTIKSGQFKDIGSYSRPMTDQERAMLQSLINESYNRFVQIVAQNRHLSIDQVKSFADGRIYSGVTAKQLGMVDQLGDLSTAQALAKQLSGIKSAQIVEYTAATPFSLRSLLGALNTQLHGNDALAALQLLGENRSKPSMELYYLAN